MSRVNEWERAIRQFVIEKKKQICVHFWRIYPVIDNEFRHNIVKVVYGSTRLSPRGPTTTLTMLWRDSSSIKWQTHILFPNLIGLTLNLFIETAQYVPEVSQAAGARIVIHNQGEMPFPDEDGINLVPGFSTSVGVRRVYILIIIIQRKAPTPLILSGSLICDPQLGSFKRYVRYIIEGFVFCKSK